MAALSQLSYSPVEGEFIREVSTRPPSVARGEETQMQEVLAADDLRLGDRLVQVRIERERMFASIPDGTAVPPALRSNVQKLARPAHQV